MMTKKIVLAGFLVGALLVLPLASFAETAASTTPPGQDNQFRTGKLENRLKNFADRVTERLNTALKNLSDLGEKVGAYVTKLESQGINTTEIKAQQDKFKTAVSDAQTAVTALATKLSTTITGSVSQLTRPQAQNLGSLVSAAVRAVNNAHKMLQQLIRQIRQAMIGHNKSLPNPAAATSSASN